MELKRLPITNPGSEPFADFADKQLKIFWLPDEIKVEKDIQDVLVNFTPAERHGVITTLKLFTIYEDFAGEEFWGGRFKKMFETDTAALRMASVFSMFEQAVHAVFYRKINELLHIDNEEFYLEYKQTPAMLERMKHVDAIVNDPDDCVSLGMFSMVEGVVLYSNFAYLKHFQSQGKNKLINLVRGINFSLKDENLHSVAGAFAFKYKMAERKRLFPLGHDLYVEGVQQKIRAGAMKLYEHEREIIKETFKGGKQEGITEHQLDNFVQTRINDCLVQLGFSKMFDVKYDPISEWFFKAINDYAYNDNFSGLNSQYHRNWDSTAFTWKKAEQ